MCLIQVFQLDLRLLCQHSTLVPREFRYGHRLHDANTNHSPRDILSASADSLPTLLALKGFQNNLATTGLQGNTIYDILDDDALSGAGMASVNITTFDVSCGTLPTLNIQTLISANTTLDPNNPVDSLPTLMVGNETASFTWIPFSK